LLSLMRNQIDAAKRVGVHAVEKSSENEPDLPKIEAQLKDDKVDILIIAPEQLANEAFNNLLGGIPKNISMLVIDEAHCISDWGHDFRPHYRMIKRILDVLPNNVRLLATTATANGRVMKDLCDILGPNLEVSRGDLNRESLSLQTIRLRDQAERLAWLAERMGEMEGNGIIYTLTIRGANQVADWLKVRGFDVEAYSSEAQNRAALEQALLDNKVKALVATMALGMGFDKPDLAFVIHYQMPGSVIAYYQQVGRAGRALESAHAVLLGIEKNEADLEIVNWFIHSAFPKREDVDDILDALEKERDGLTIPGLCSRVNVTKKRIEQTTLLLSLESPAPIVKHDSKWQLTAATLSGGFWERVERLTDLRNKELEQMKAYAGLPFGEHMGFLIKALDGDPKFPTPPPACKGLPTTVKEELVRDAIKYLKRTGLSVEPRKKWPDYGMPNYKVKGNIADDRRAQSGKVLCRYGDAGWGEMVKQGKYKDGRFADDLVEACVEMIREWNAQPKPTWVTCIPSSRHPELVPDFARRLALTLGMPFYAAIKKVRDTPEQKTMQNPTQQARNIDGSLELDTQLVQRGPVLLVDDMVDSRWTLTVAAWLLRYKGKSGDVWPMALADAGRTSE
jgi:ATP-dependent DNA helicase RecQ